MKIVNDFAFAFEFATFALQNITGLYDGLDAGLDVIYQTRATVFHRDIQTPRRELKIRRAAEYF